MENNNLYHKSVLVNEVLEYLKPTANKVYVDATFGAGGHTRAILELDPTIQVIAFDWDKNAIEINGPAFQETYGDRFHLMWSNFSNITNMLKAIGIKQVDGILADFGTSQYQIKQSAGFSFNVDTPLDMRMSPGHFRITAYDIINKASEKELTDIFYKYGQDSNSKKIAKAIIEIRKTKNIRTTKDLAQLIESIVPRQGSKIHPATRVFQALRIVINDELNNIRSLLSQSVNLLKENSPIVCISFHSLEDGMVKQFFRDHGDVFNVLTRHVVTASDEELKNNPSSRSAKLRAAEKK